MALEVTSWPSGAALGADGDSTRIGPERAWVAAVVSLPRFSVGEDSYLLTRTLSRQFWARLAVSDYRECFRPGFAQRDRRLRRMKGRLYGPLSLSEEGDLTGRLRNEKVALAFELLANEPGLQPGSILSRVPA